MSKRPDGRLNPGISAGDPSATWSGQFAGTPDGVITYRPEFGQKVGTFTKRRKDLDPPNWQSRDPLMFHVPREFRGNYRPEQLANFNSEYDYTVDNSGFRLCEAETKKGTGTCRVRAANRQPYCESHGARLHPLDKITAETLDPGKMNRYQLLMHGYIDVEDLTDEEITQGMVGSGGPKTRVMFPRELYQKILDRHFARAQELLKEALIPSVMALASIAANEDEIYEAQDRIKASAIILDRVLGKSPLTVSVGVAAEPWEQLVSGMRETTRAASRAQRGIESADSEYTQIGDRIWDGDGNEIIEGEVVPSVDNHADTGVVVGSRGTESVPAESVTVGSGTRKRPAKAERDDTHVSGKPRSDEELKARIREMTVVPEPIPKKRVARKRSAPADIKGGDSGGENVPVPKVRVRRPIR